MKNKDEIRSSIRKNYARFAKEPTVVAVAVAAVAEVLYKC